MLCPVDTEDALLRPGDLRVESEDDLIGHLSKAKRIAADPLFGADAESLKASLDPARYVGRAPEQVDDFLNEVVKPLLAENADLLGLTGEVRV